VISRATVRASSSSDAPPETGGAATSLFGRVCVRLIRAYQSTSRFRPAVCRFHPTCSEYTAQAILRHGPWAGMWLGVKRIARCHPFYRGDWYDPVPGTEDGEPPAARPPD
jgi:conserved hypothetical protein YidD